MYETILTRSEIVDGKVTFIKTKITGSYNELAAQVRNSGFLGREIEKV